MSADEHRQVEFETPSPSVQRGSGLQEHLRKYLKERRAAGYSYVNSNNIRRDLQWFPNPQKVGAALRMLREAGDLERHTRSSPATFRITIDEEDSR